MRQTENALHMLSASYRAVLRHAYFTGIASSFVVCGFGGAYAATYDTGINGEDNDLPLPSAAPTWGAGQNVIINEKITVQGSQQAANVTINGKTAGLSVRYSGDSVLNFSESLNVNDGYIHISGDGISRNKVTGAAVGSKTVTGSFNSAGGTVNINNAVLEVNETVISGGKVTLSGSAADTTVSGSDNYLNYSGIYSGLNGGTTTISGADVKLQDHSVITTPGTLSVNGANITFDSSFVTDDKKAYGENRAKAVISAADININGNSQITVNSQKGGSLFANSMHIGAQDGSSAVKVNIASGGMLQIAGKAEITPAQIAVNAGLKNVNYTAGTVNINGGSEITNAGNLFLGAHSVKNVYNGTATTTALSAAELNVNLNSGSKLINSSNLKVGGPLRDSDERALLSASAQKGTTLNVLAGSELSNNQGATVNVETGSELILKGGTFNNSGSLTAKSGSAVKIEGDLSSFKNSGTVNLNSGSELHITNVTPGASVDISGINKIDNQGAVVLNNGTFTAGSFDKEITANSVNNGSGSGGQLEETISKGQIKLNNAVLTVSGDIDTTSSNLNLGGIRGEGNSALFGNNSVRLTLNQLAGDTFAGLKTIGGKDVVLNNNTSGDTTLFTGSGEIREIAVTGSLSESKGKKIELRNASLRLTDSESVTGIIPTDAESGGTFSSDLIAGDAKATIKVEKGTWTGAGNSVSAQSGGLISISGTAENKSVLKVKDTVLNSGNLHLNNGTLNSGISSAVSGEVILTSGSELGSADSSDIFNLTDTELSASGSKITAAQVNISGGDFQSDYSVVKANNISLSGGNFKLNNSTLTNAPTVNASGAAIVFSGSAADIVSLSLSGGTLNAEGGSVNVSTAFALNGQAQASFSGSELSSSGSVTADGGSSLSINGGTFNFTDLNLSGGSSFNTANKAAVSGNNITLSADSVININGNTDAKNPDTSLSVNTLRTDQSQTPPEGEEPALTAGKVNVGAGGLLQITGDGNSGSVDLIADVSVNNGKVNLGKAADTLSVTFDQTGQNFNLGSDYRKLQLSGTSSVVAVDLSGLGVTTITKGQLGALQSQLADGTIGRIDLKGITVENAPIKDGVINAGDTVDSSGNIDLGYSDENIRNAALKGIEQGMNVAGSIGYAETTDGSPVSILTGKELVLNNADNSGRNLIQGADGTAAGAVINNDSTLTLNGSGNIGQITGSGGALKIAANTDITVKAPAPDEGTPGGGTPEEGEDSYSGSWGIDMAGGSADIAGSLKLTGMRTGKLNLSGSVRADRIITADTSMSQGSYLESAGEYTAGNISGTGKIKAGALKAQSLQFNSGSVVSVSGDMNVTGAVKGSGTEIAAANITAGYVDLNAGVLKSNNLNSAGQVNIDGNSAVELSGNLSASGPLNVAGGSSLTALQISVSGGDITVGREQAGGLSGSSGHIRAENIALNGNDLIIDPEFGQETATVFTENFGPAVTDEGTQTGTKAEEEPAVGIDINGNILVGRNSALGIGDNEQNFRQALAKLQKDGSLREDDIGALFYTDKADLRIGNNKIVVGTEDINVLRQKLTAADSIYMGKGSGIQVTASAISAAGESGSVFSDLGADKSIRSEGGTLIVPANMSKEQLVKIFGKEVQLADNGPIKVRTENGLYNGVIDSADDLHGTGDFEFTIDENTEQTVKSVLSSPVSQYLTAVMSNETKHYATQEDFLAALNGGTPPVTDPDQPTDPNQPTDPDNPGEQSLATAALPSVNPTNSAYGSNNMAVAENAAGYNFLQDAFGSDVTAIEKATRLAAFGRATGAAYNASALVSSTVKSRLNTGVITADGREYGGGNGASMWISPVYRSSSADGFSSDGISYGGDTDLFGMAGGFEFSFNSRVKAGLMLAAGTGDVTGKGAGRGVNNDFSFTAMSLYTGFKPAGNLNIGADLSFGKTDNELSAASGMAGYGSIRGDTDSSFFSAGVLAEYEFNNGYASIRPYGGLRLTHLETDDFTVNTDAGEIAKSRTSDADIISIPLGIAVSQEYETSTGKFRPFADLSLTFNAGDTDVKGSTSFNGVYGSEVNYNTELIDSVSYGIRAGLEAESGNFSAGFSAGYTGSSNTDEFDISAQAKLRF